MVDFLSDLEDKILVICPSRCIRKYIQDICHSIVCTGKSRKQLKCLFLGEWIIALG